MPGRNRAKAGAFAYVFIRVAKIECHLIFAPFKRWPQVEKKSGSLPINTTPGRLAPPIVGLIRHYGDDDLRHLTRPRNRPRAPETTGALPQLGGKKLLSAPNRRQKLAGVQPTALPECIFDLSLDPITENGKRRNHGRTDPFSATNTGSATRSGEFGRTHLTFMVRTAIFINFLIAESCLAVA